MSDEKQKGMQAGEPGAEAPRPQESGATSAPGGGSPPKRFSAKRKLEAVQRLMAGESLEAVSRDLAVPVSRLSEWRDRALSAAEANLKAQAPDPRDEEITRLQNKVGELTMDQELLEEKIQRLEASRPLARRRSRK